MDLHVIAIGEHKIIEGPQDAPLLQAPDDVVRVIEVCFEQHTRLVLLYAENLTSGFFDLSSGDAGAILQKLRQYHIRLAVVASPERAPLSMRFQQMMIEERRGSHFHIFEDAEVAEAWLAGS